jgi:hypothetical protein
MPGTDPRESIAIVLGELPELPYLPELPGRGPGADLIGRTAGLLVDLPVQTTPRGWKLASRPGRDAGRAASYLSADLDTMEEAAEGFSGTFKIQSCGPWTLAASLELGRSLEPALTDEGAVADLTGSLAEGLAAHVGAVRRRLPGATVLLQLDEPMLPGVLAGSLSSASGLYRLPPAEQTVVADGLRTVIEAAGAPAVVHCCAQGIPFGALPAGTVSAMSFDLSLLRRSDEDEFGTAVESGIGMFIGAVPATPGRPAAGTRQAAAVSGRQVAAPAPDRLARDTATAVIGLWRRVGLRADLITEQVVITPACGLAGAPPGYARAALERCAAAARFIPELIEEGVR